MSDSPTMHNKFHHVLDACIGVVTTGITSIATWVLAATYIDQADELKLLLVPLIGALIASGGMIMLTPRPETRQIVIGRAMFSLLFGSATPQLVALVHPAMQSMTDHPVLLLIAGALASMFFYAVSKPFTAGLYARSKDVADAALDAGEIALRKKLQSEIKETVKETVKEVAEESRAFNKRQP